jgi:hypothetical protein
VCLFAATVFCQTTEPIRFDQIGPKKVRTLLTKTAIENTADFEKMLPACFGEASFSGSSRHIYTFEMAENIETVWKAYRSLDPRELGQEQIISFGLCYSRRQNQLIYAGDDCGSIQEGQIIVSGLRYLGGLVKLAVAQEITEINDEERFLTFCYMENGKTVGSQKIRFFETPEGATEIVHETFYRSKSKFRDKKLYPGLHEKTIVELHEKVRMKLDSGLFIVAEDRR